MQFLYSPPLYPWETIARRYDQMRLAIVRHIALKIKLYLCQVIQRVQVVQVFLWVQAVLWVQVVQVFQRVQAVQVGQFGEQSYSDPAQTNVNTN